MNTGLLGLRTSVFGLLATGSAKNMMLVILACFFFVYFFIAILIIIIIFFFFLLLCVLVQISGSVCQSILMTMRVMIKVFTRTTMASAGAAG